MMLLGVIYMAAIFMVEVIGKNEGFQDDEGIQKRWSNLPSAMLALLQVATYEDWGAIVEYVDNCAPGIFVFFLVFVTISGLGILNLVCGVMVQAAFKVMNTSEASQTKQVI